MNRSLRVFVMLCSVFIGINLYTILQKSTTILPQSAVYDFFEHEFRSHDFYDFYLAEIYGTPLIAPTSQTVTLCTYLDLVMSDICVYKDYDPSISETQMARFLQESPEHYTILGSTIYIMRDELAKDDDPLPRFLVYDATTVILHLSNPNERSE